MKNYYADKLSSGRLKQVYEIAPLRIRQYLETELNYVLQKVSRDDIVLELGCGYGRIFPELSLKVKSVAGIDIAMNSLILGKELCSDFSNCFFIQMDAVKLAFLHHSFDKVLCIQNGISAFHVNQKELILECVRITKPGGTIFFSSYSDKIWNDRLEWFELQSEAGLLGEIDYNKTGNGIIVCKDGFTATTMDAGHFNKLTSNIEDITVITEEVDESSIFFNVHCSK
ncbi:MAG: class I SAM-dependent methyltransferase [Ignavibacteriales bacterium]|nr:MAG: class I SAM-dependent methyltransferase [Ignavibacteriales bacterium]